MYSKISIRTIFDCLKRMKIQHFTAKILESINIFTSQRNLPKKAFEALGKIIVPMINTKV